MTKHHQAPHPVTDAAAVARALAQREPGQTFSSYEEYLQSEHWKVVRTLAFERDRYRCQKCGKRKSLQAHHINYPKRWIDTTRDDLITVCKRCHQSHHNVFLLGEEPQPPSWWTLKRQFEKRQRAYGRSHGPKPARSGNFIKSQSGTLIYAPRT